MCYASRVYARHEESRSRSAAGRGRGFPLLLASLRFFRRRRRGKTPALAQTKRPRMDPSQSTLTLKEPAGQTQSNPVKPFFHFDPIQEEAEETEILGFRFLFSPRAFGQNPRYGFRLDRQSSHGSTESRPTVYEWRTKSRYSPCLFQAAGYNGRMEISELIQCPYCGQRFDLMIDTGVPSQRFVTDCEICCRPFEVVAECEPGEILSLEILSG